MNDEFLDYLGLGGIVQLDFSQMEKAVMAAASLELLKGGASKFVTSATAVQSVTPVDDNTVEIDPAKLTEEDIAALIVEFSLPTPDDWSALSLEQKQEYIRTKCEDGDQPSETPAPVFEEQAGSFLDEAVSAAGKAAGKSKAKKSKEPAANVATDDAPEAKESKKKSKGKDVAVAAVEGEILDKGDVLVSIVHDIENMDDEHLKEAVFHLYDTNDMNRFKLGGVLSVIMNKKLYEPQTFNEFVEEKYGFDWRSARYLIDVYRAIVNAKIDWDTAKKLGWTKIMKLGKVLNPSNTDYWLQIAATQTVKQLEQSIKNASKPALADGTKEDNKPTVKSFKLHDEQVQVITAALEKAKNASGTEVDSQALEYVCSDFLGSYTLAQSLQNIGFEKAVEAFMEAFPDKQISLTE